ncbi:aromatic amino acid DMT transporter YddG [Pectobacteriaceae bacterium C52]|uniref:Drug/metabolite DMT transporter permease n=1 Tax=Serratia sp. (strain ATCC 39006) TaxID=104623 RepID=A0A2I5TDA8_SERS3|nr:aromatic amino acid DMT transporter YddG [Serratia sp. ATCC 39006]AUH02543.1 drug/metabolite DMT transporter permease [Serratia sp. ATCC 39006]AUH06859.1 drug/metabolite DMT transporter permease [Serratia sp. ATCC 39006]WJV64716.1 aromatic amino acid DMT transporter YddG [Pectobacteriaceae bacterium C52]
MTSQRATLVGLSAILLWSTSVGLIRRLTESLGPLGGAAMIYSSSALCLILFNGFPPIKSQSKIYLLLGGALFVCYEIFFSLAIGFASNRMQAMELGMINYLWPCLTILFAIVINQQKSRFFLWPGIALSLAGIVWIMKGDGVWSLSLMWHNIIANPVAYGLAFAAAIVWALYCNVSRRFGGGKSGISLFFVAVSAVLWRQYLFSEEPVLSFSLTTVLELLFIAGSTALSYMAWDIGIQRGNLTLLATASYFTPMLSALLSALWLNIIPTFSFWQGVLMITVGSLLSWMATRSS